MKILRLISLLIDYPTAELIAEKNALLAVVASSGLPAEHAESLSVFIENRCRGDSVDGQEE